MSIVDKLIENTIKTKNPAVIGLDPDLAKIPNCYKKYYNSGNSLKDVAEVIFLFNKDIIDTISSLVPAVKPQMAFYEKYGSYGIVAFEKTVEYAKKMGLVVIEDGKRNDIGNTARAYAEGHLGTVTTLTGEKTAVFDVDFLTVSPFLGSESLLPFIDICAEHDKGIFVLIKTSNSSAGEIQDVVNINGETISQMLTKFIAKKSNMNIGKYNYSAIGAVVGATYPDDAKRLRDLMPNNYFLVPGYGAQGGNASDILPCFNDDGLGAIVNSSRGILYDHMTKTERESCSKEEYLKSVVKATLKMQDEIYTSLKKQYPKMIY
jgi:orotidine-5'-phosphate decarboxylase